MLPRPKAPASPRRPQTPTPSEQDGDHGPANPRDTEAQRLRFRQFQYHVAGGPHLALGQLWSLCRQWLRPEARSKEQMLELLVLEQFLGALPSKMRTWVQSQGPRNCREAASLVEDLTQMCQQEVLVSLDSVEHQDWSFGEEEDRKSPRSQREPSQASELILDAAAAASAPPEESEWPEPTQLPQGVHTRAEAEPPRAPGSMGSRARLPLKPSIWDEPEEILPGPSSDLRAEGAVTSGPKGLSAQRISPRKKNRNTNQGGRRQPSLKHTKAGTQEAATGTPGAPRGPRGGRPFQCADCGMVFTWVTHFIEHQKTHREEGPFPCPECGKVFLHSSVLAEHSKIHLLEPPKKKGPRSKGPRESAPPRDGAQDPAAPRSPKRPFRCSVCGKSFPWMVHLIDHQKLHTVHGHM
ncbi:zinc finger and SCAN domain-containing protein 1 [Callithrix jacchus]|uniref:Zinc finger and SCAN domain containing 1 n=1 Tax=Callithrix jacchus TaxID=9483 RepID=U3EI90_CALJA|nr:zinc finger and SCAN domain-containing protein 1 [Callithrix jacchus]XP_035142158.1 zinc finger and SCAN domain-containing protein 1 [Callithrix jacchus]XP_035142160.1 zinc finger and SCAN domain-containing protein 1 [Callithrix jacchus]XP_035142161.1 zinc finger and SCAN domain-containing protein 1 [Callithrix jacchus]XP_035142162.1 zinc finger and SCAN domain-containing protein 1 [Callithrix jacchus]XP_035142163.1 zinc finger and SCAN domain-containing protein 1 [Callithrix jacchus]XP_05